MNPWAQAVYDTLSAVTSQDVIDEVLARDMFEVLPLTHIRGRSLHDSFVIVDEAQSLEQSVLLTVLSRIGSGSRVVLTHDIAQRDNLRVGRHDGVVAVIEKLKGHPLFAHVTLVRSERSPIAALVTEMLEDSGSVTRPHADTAAPASQQPGQVGRLLPMAFDLAELLAARHGEGYALADQHLNPQLPRMLHAIGFDRSYERAEGAYLYDSDGHRVRRLPGRVRRVRGRAATTRWCARRCTTCSTPSWPTWSSSTPRCCPACSASGCWPRHPGWTGCTSATAAPRRSRRR